MFVGACLLALVAGAHGGGWRWPDEARAASVRIDTKVRFLDDDSRRPNKVQADEIKPPVDTEGFYNRPEGAGSGRYAVQSAPQRLTRPQYSDGTLDSIQYCKCVESPGPACNSPRNYPKACSPGMHLCCYKIPHKDPQDALSELFSEIDDERPVLLPNYEKRTGPFVASPEETPHVLIGTVKPSRVHGYENTPSYTHTHSILFGPVGPPGVLSSNRHDNKILVGPSGPTGSIGPNRRDPEVFVGPDGPTGFIGPNQRNPGVLVGPDGPTGNIGPNHSDNRLDGANQRNPGVLVGPGGPTGNIGPNHRHNRLDGANQRNPGVLVGPEGPTGNIGPNHRENRLVDGTNQRNPGVLVGPGGPTGNIGPNHRDNRFDGANQRNPGVLVGPGGPTGNIGPNHRDNRLIDGTNQRNPGVLVGPSPGPTGSIGPGDNSDLTRPHKKHNLAVLVGPDGPTGQIGPHYRDDRGPTDYRRPNHHNPELFGSDDSSPWVLIGPGGPTGGYGPDPHKQGVHFSNQGAESAQVLVGPGGPTGVIGPGERRGRWQGGPGLLVGPNGPTGIIGPGRRLLVGPGGPTGRLGPRGYGQYGF